MCPLFLDGMRRSTPISASAKLALINALKGAIPEDGGRPVKKHSKPAKECEPSTKRMKSRVPMRRDSSEVMAELVAQLTKAASST
jgi:hypothetical protein